VRLPGFAGILSHRTQPGRCFDHEISERLRVIACLMARPFMAHTDQVDSPVSASTWGQLRAALRASADDAVVLVWGPSIDVATAVEEIVGRSREALVGVPSETRQAHRDGTTGFERILPGPERMYPDTDTPPWPVPDAWLEEIDAQRPPRPQEHEQRFIEGGLSMRAARILIDRELVGLFDALAPTTELGRRRLAAALECRLLAFWREVGGREVVGREVVGRAQPSADRLRPLVEAIDAGRLRSEAYDAVFDALLRESEAKPEAIVERFGAVDGAAAGAKDDLSRAIEMLRMRMAALRFSSEAARLRWAMGRVMPLVLGRLSPAFVRERLIQGAMNGS
jgi:Glu-tRNA(Gln) amidotransferase subunit E-like FAD-binding protein